MASARDQIPIQNSDIAAAHNEKKDDTSDAETHNENPSGDLTDADRAFYNKYGTYDRYEITEEDCYDELGFSFPAWKKWYVFFFFFSGASSWMVGWVCWVCRWLTFVIGPS